MNEYDIPSNVESNTESSGNDWILTTSDSNIDNTSSYTDTDYLQGIYEITSANTAFVAVIMFIIVIAGFTSLLKNFYD